MDKEAKVAVFESELSDLPSGGAKSQETPTRPPQGRGGTTARKTGQGARPDTDRLVRRLAQTFDAADVEMRAEMPDSNEGSEADGK